MHELILSDLLVVKIPALNKGIDKQMSYDNSIITVGQPCDNRVTTM